MWIFYALIHSLSRAAFVETNRVFRADGARQSFWQGLFALVALSPLLPFAAWPSDPLFYAAAAGSSLILTAGALANNALSGERNGRHAGIHMPLEALVATALWLAIEPAALRHMIASPLLAALLAVSFVVVTATLLGVRRDRITWPVFLVVVPVGISYAVAGVVTKIVVLPYGVLPLAIAYAVVNFVVMTAATALYLGARHRGRPGLQDDALIKGGMAAGLCSAIGYTAFVAAVAHAPNPGYVSAAAMLLPLWLLLWRRRTGAPCDIALPRAAVLGAGVGVFLCAATLL